MSEIKLTCARVMECGPKGGVYVRYVLEENGAEIGRFLKRAECQHAYTERRAVLLAEGKRVRTTTRDWYGHWDGIDRPVVIPRRR